MPADPRKHLWDALEAARKIQRFAAGLDLQAYQADELVRSAVERQFEIIGECLVRLRREHPDIAAQVPNLHRIIAFRNVLVHGYASIDDKLVWGVVEAQLPALCAHLNLELDRFSTD